MCQNFICGSCNIEFFDRCDEAPFESTTHCGKIKSSDTTVCEACRTVEGAIFDLRTLLVVAPFLETVGIAGLESISTWEREGLEMVLVKKDRKGWEDKAKSREERHNIAKKVETMGLGGIEDGRDEHQGFVTVITPADNGNEGIRKEVVVSNESDKENVPPLDTRVSGW